MIVDGINTSFYAACFHAVGRRCDIVVYMSDLNGKTCVRRLPWFKSDSPISLRMCMHALVMYTRAEDLKLQMLHTRVCFLWLIQGLFSKQFNRSLNVSIGSVPVCE